VKTPTEPSPSVAPAPAPAAAPVANRATIRLAGTKQSLTVDGKRSPGASVVVACGAHTVAVGTEKPRRVEAPCGRTLLVDVGKSKLAKDDGARAEGKARVVPPKKH
jgi:hypothetical protein